jgi:hypothetical protein
LDGIDRLADLSPVVVGAKVTWTVHEVEEARTLWEQESATMANSDGLEPASAIVPKASGCVPLLVKVKDCADDLVPTLTLPKLNAAGDADSRAVVLSPALPSTMPEGVSVPSEMVSDPVSTVWPVTLV